MRKIMMLLFLVLAAMPMVMATETSTGGGSGGGSTSPAAPTCAKACLDCNGDGVISNDDGNYLMWNAPDIDCDINGDGMTTIVGDIETPSWANRQDTPTYRATRTRSWDMPPESTQPLGPTTPSSDPMPGRPTRSQTTTHSSDP